MYVSWKEFALNAYYFSTLPARRRAAIDRAAQHSEPVRILFYHRVADDFPNRWTMPTRTFASQIHWLRERFDLVTLAEAQKRIASGRNRFPTACITFDDGYADNRRSAIPLLLKHNIPFTYFVSTDHVLGGQPFPHDVESGPASGRQHARPLARAGGGRRRDRSAHAKPLPTWAQLILPIELQDEIVGSKRELEDALGIPVRYFAFPYGQHENMSPVAFRIAYEAGFDGCLLSLRRLQLPGRRSVSSPPISCGCEFIRFMNWMTVDPRKVRLQRDFDPGDFRNDSVEISRRGAESAEAARLVDVNTLHATPSFVN